MYASMLCCVMYCTIHYAQRSFLPFMNVCMDVHVILFLSRYSMLLCIRGKKIKGYMYIHILFMILGQSRIHTLYLFYMLFTICFLFFVYIYLEQIQHKHSTKLNIHMRWRDLINSHSPNINRNVQSRVEQQLFYIPQALFLATWTSLKEKELEDMH